MPAPMPSPAHPAGEKGQVTEPLVYQSAAAALQPATVTPSEPVASVSAAAPPPKTSAARKKPGFFHRVGHFFGRIFGAE